MPFIGLDWRAPGETWVRTPKGWERMKLRPLQRYASDTSLERPARTHSDSESSNDMFPDLLCPSQSYESMGMNGRASANAKDDRDSEDEYQLPHCFVKFQKSKEFVGCTSMSEAFLKLDLTRAVTDVNRFNYICKIIQILVQEKLHNLSGSARRILLSLIEATVTHCLDDCKELTTARLLVSDFMHGLTKGHHYGSPTMISSHQESLGALYKVIANHAIAPADSNEDAVTILDLPKECLHAILRQLPDHTSLLASMKALEALDLFSVYETKLWEGLCHLHFSQQQMEGIFDKLGYDKRLVVNGVKVPGVSADWRHVYFESKKFFGLKELYADMIHICCHCKALFWKKLGHPCVSKTPAPAVRVTPQQFIDMLLYI
uniref:F-box domain-containing protein n=1 Tax=Trichuris muris TaxID=70415 RepID=A0A5S6QAX6_TRIMR